MNKTTKVIVTLLLVGIAATGFYLWKLNQSKPADTVAVAPDQLFGWKYPVTKFPRVGAEDTEIAYSDIRDPGGIPEGLPVRLKVPIIGVNSAIEDAFITPDGRMDVPAGSRNVAWFALGPHPGNVGSAVIGGHFGLDNNVKRVFYDLDKLVIGDKVYVEDDQGNTLTFQVRRIQLFERDADATTVFTSDDGLAHLNLITCEGVWNRVNDSYPLRRVVFTDLIPTIGVAPTGVSPSGQPIQPTTTFGIDFPRSLTIGSQGADVAALQTALEQKGLLTMPAGIVKGYFGSLTRDAVSKYQVSVGLPSAGYFGPLTKAKLISDVVVVDKPMLPTTAITEPVATSATGSVTKSPAFLQTFTEILSSLFATPRDAFITTLLLVAIAFVGASIIRK